MIGLDTGHLVYNYGTKLQAYAMQTLLEKNGDKCEIIQWHTKDFKIFNGIVDYYKKILKIYKLYGFKYKYWLKAYKRYTTFDKFNKKFHIHKFYGSFKDMEKSLEQYSTVFCGSDQAWLPENVIKHCYTLEYCDDKIFKAAYAPSFGIDKIDDQYKEKYITFLSRINSLSVREISGQKIIKQLINKEVPVVLDPTLLVEKEIWDKLLQESKIKVPNEKYIFCYLLGQSKSHREEILKLSKSTGCKIVNLQHFYRYCETDENFADYNLYDVSPQDFIKLIANAEFVCTDSFHCTIFSIHYKRDFFVFQRFSNKDKQSTNTRLYSLLSQLKLEDRIVEKITEENMNKINYEQVNEKIVPLRKISDEYMKNALEGKSNV